MYKALHTALMAARAPHPTAAGLVREAASFCPTAPLFRHPHSATWCVIWIVRKCPCLWLPEKILFFSFSFSKSLHVPVQSRQPNSIGLLLQRSLPRGTFIPNSDRGKTAQQLGASSLQLKNSVLNCKLLPEEGRVIYKVTQGVEGGNQRLLSRWRKEAHIRRG